MACNSNNPKKLNVSYYLKSTKFNEEQIRGIYTYYCKYANDELYLNFSDFKKSLGVLGAKSHDFICRRIFNLIDTNRKFEVISQFTSDLI
jgi:Ca2+-binding EF-hand superfamily protein